MALITQKITGDKVMELGSEMFIRPMAMGINWQKIRIGIRYAFNGGSTMPGAGLMLGVCAGTSWDYDSPYVDLVGGHFGSSVFNTLYTFVAGTPSYYTIDTTSTLGVTKYGATVSTSGAATNLSYMSANPSASRCIYFVDITRGTSTYTVKLWLFNSAAAAQTDRNRQTFTGWMMDETTAGGVLAAGSSGTPTYIGGGLLNSVFVRWNKSSVPIDISDLSVVRFT